MRPKIVLVLACCLLASAAQAQFSDDFWDTPDYYEQRERTQRYSDRQDQALQQELDRYPNVEDTDEYQSWDRLRALEGCNALTNNPAAQSMCLQGIR